MAFYSNYSNDSVSHNILDENEEPMAQSASSDPTKDSQSSYKEAYHSDDYLSNDQREKLYSENGNHEDNEMNKHQSVQADVPADEMLSDEYYEQDEGYQSDHVHYKGYSNPTNSRSLPKIGSAAHNKAMTSRTICKSVHSSDCYYGHNDDADIDYEEEEDDADFEPYDFVHDGGARKKLDQACDVSDEDSEDDYGTKKPTV